jgi:hypothetical protein
MLLKEAKRIKTLIALREILLLRAMMSQSRQKGRKKNRKKVMKAMKMMTMKISMVRKSLRINIEYRSNHKTDRILKLLWITKAYIRSCSLFFHIFNYFWGHCKV